MTQRFLNFIGFVIDHEGRTFEDDKDDPGGQTKFGIDHRSHPGVDIKNLTENESKEIYFSEWQSAGCETLAPKLGESHFDARVNCGTGRATKFLKASKFDPAKYNDERIAFYHRLVIARPKSEKYLRGWINRVNDLGQFLNIS